MPVIFDEVIATVVPDTTPPTAAGAPASVPPPPQDAKTHLRRLERRTARLRAD